MKVLALALMLTTLAVATAQTDSTKFKLRERWKLVDCNDLSCYYYDQKTIQYKGIITAWVIMYMKKGKKFFMVREQFDCTNRASRVLTLIEYNESGNKTGEDLGVKDWEDIPPDTLGEEMLDTLCNVPASDIPPVRKKPVVVVPVDDPPPLPKKKGN